MNLFEYEGKQLMREYGIPVPESRLITSPDEPAPLPFPFVLKAQVMTGGRGKAGGVKVCRNEEEYRRYAGEILRMEIKGHRVHGLLAEQMVKAEKKNLLVAMFQTAYEKYIPTLEEDGVLVIDPGLVTELVRPIRTTFEVPATQIAVDLGNRMAANMVMLGFLSESMGIIGHQDLLDVVKDTVNPRFTELNFQAVEAGAAYAKEHGLYH